MANLSTWSAAARRGATWLDGAHACVERLAGDAATQRLAEPCSEAARDAHGKDLRGGVVDERLPADARHAVSDGRAERGLRAASIVGAPARVQHDEPEARARPAKDGGEGVGANPLDGALVGRERERSLAVNGMRFAAVADEPHEAWRALLHESVDGGRAAARVDERGAAGAAEARGDGVRLDKRFLQGRDARRADDDERVHVALVHARRRCCWHGRGRVARAQALKQCAHVVAERSVGGAWAAEGSLPVMVRVKGMSACSWSNGSDVPSVATKAISRASLALTASFCSSVRFWTCRVGPSSPLPLPCSTGPLHEA